MRHLAVFALIVAVATGLALMSARDAGDVSVDPNTAPPAATADSTATEPSPPVSESAPTTRPTPVPVRRIEVAFSGEILSHLPIIEAARANGSSRFTHDYRPMFARVRPILEAVDLAVCHLETPISSDDVGLSGYPTFNAPRSLARSIGAVGYDTCSTASNHSFDRGVEGIVSTIDRLEDAGVGWAGMARTEAEQATPHIDVVDGIAVAHLSYTYGLNGFALPEGQEYLVNVTDVDAVLAEAGAARAAGADIVVLSIQWGNEYQVEPSPEQVSLARRLLRSNDIDLIVGSHVHVVQPIDLIGGEYVIYGLGNSLSNQSAACCPAASQNGIIAVAEITGTDDAGYRVSGLSIVTTRVDLTDYTIVPLESALAAGGLEPATRSLYEQVVADTAEVLNRRGASIDSYVPESSHATVE